MLSTNDFLVTLEPGKKNDFQKYLKNNSNLVNYKFWRRITTIIDGKYSDNQVLKKMKRINKEYMASDSKNMVLIDGELNKQFLDCINDKLLDKNKLERILAGCKKSAQRLLDTDVQNFQKIYTTQTRDRRLTDISCFDENKNANTDDTNISYILIEKLLTKNFAVLNLFVELATINNVDIGLESQVLTFLEQKKLLIGFFDWAFDERMKKTLGETEMLREDGVDTKLLREIEKKYATTYIIKVMKKSIKKIMKDPKAYIIKSNQENNNKNISNVCKICEEILTTIENKILDIPKILMDLCTMIKEKSINKFGGDGSNSIISLFFLRIIQKGLLFPQNYGMIREEKITSDVRSALSSISKSLKNIVCGVIDEDETRSGVDEMVVTWKLRVRKILQNVCSPLSPMSLKLKSMTIVPQTDLNNLFYGYSFQSLCDTFRIILPRIRTHVEKWDIKDKEQVLPILENINKSLPQKGRSFSGPKKPEFFSPQPERKMTATLSRKLFNKSFERPKLDHLFIDSNLDK